MEILEKKKIGILVEKTISLYHYIDNEMENTEKNIFYVIKNFICHQLNSMKNDLIYNKILKYISYNTINGYWLLRTINNIIIKDRYFKEISKAIELR